MKTEKVVDCLESANGEDLYWLRDAGTNIIKPEDLYTCKYDLMDYLGSTETIVVIQNYCEDDIIVPEKVKEFYGE